MHKILAILFFCCCGNILFAQKDSIALKQDKYLSYTDSIQQQAFRFSKNNPLLITNLMPNQISAISLGHQYEKGNFILAQGSTKTNTIFLNTEGTTVLGKIKLYGSFAYKKIFEDSTRFAHQTRNNPSTPYYYGSPTYNHYERTKYDFKALANRNFWNDRLTFGLLLDYHVADHFSNNDPRGSIKEYQLDTKALLGYNFTKNIQVGLGYHIGYGQEGVNIGYRNRNYYETLNYPAYVNYVINGYGEPVPKVTIRKYDDRMQRTGIDFSLALNNMAFGSLFLKTNVSNEAQAYDYRESTGFYDLAQYDLRKIAASLLWTKKVNSGKWNILAEIEQWDGEDFNVNFKAKNYVYTQNKVDLSVAYALSKTEYQHQFSAAIQQLGEERIDGVTGNRVYIKNLSSEISYALIKKLKNNHFISGDFSANYRFSPEDEFNVGTAVESYFTRTVIFHDYLYHTASSLGGSVGISYAFPFLKTFQGAVRLKSAYLQKQDLKSLNRTLTSIPGNDRFFNNLSLNLYF